ncbi:phage tail sheath C-terminal domain-containing protein [Longimicrobium terrae]|uniref:Phage tail sheath family protein n=1 Tax=Longimicrobium terrae TaxID=1639882 RepID=A0A841GKR1_9BACT|nr:phage tail sheath C-terminal domain-containing protein [Longimicrobium terrae]MBB4634926.1 hypothetical protein [Longimicrobium terrae]MBB6069321.1 hypothetical protein [Longimicrobium terrae]NNC31871.1 phage tail protein [Longimicrobium terrae]
MPSVLSYPGVYVEEVPSGVRTITGVSTSVTAFAGAARRGPLNRAVRVQSFADYERAFGGLVSEYELGYAVRQFFQNGGGEAWVIRLAKNASAAFADLPGATGASLRLTARDEGAAGNAIQVQVSHDTATPGSTFTLSLQYTSANATENRGETFADLSMNSSDARYVLDVVNDGSALVTAEVTAPANALSAVKGASYSGVVGDVATLVTPTANRLQVVVNGDAPVEVVLDPATDVAGADPAARLATLAGAIAGAVPSITCTPDAGRLKLESKQTGERSSVRVLPGAGNDASAALKLGSVNGGTEVDAAAAIRPAEQPGGAAVTSDTLALADVTAPAPGAEKVSVSVDGYGPDTVTLAYSAAAPGLADRLAAVAAEIQAKVRALKPANAAYAGFTATVEGGTKLRMRSGTRGPGSAVQLAAASGDTLATALKLVGSSAPVQEATLGGGGETAYGPADAYNLFIGDRAARRGIYALEAVDIFNLMCLPGVTDAGILADASAYCRERRAFLIVDAPRNAVTPDAMATLALGSALPKTDRAAVYFPWVYVADPLKGGKPRLSAPSGTIAGLYARTDASRGVWKAPAGTEASLLGVQKTDYHLTDGENGVLNPRGVNAIRTFPGVGPVAWGARTLRGDDKLADEWKYVPVRRLALYIEESLYRGTQWVVFEPNDEPLWAQIRLNLGAFMHNLFRQGAFQGKTPAQAYLVKCDADTTTQNDINLGVVNILVGFAPLKPAEFVIIRLQQKAGQTAS